MSYLPKAAGHAAREESRHVAQGTIDELVKKAEQWFDDGKWYGRAVEMTRGIETTAHTAGILALHPTLTQHRLYWTLGFFISALWNHRCPEKIITYNHNTPNVKYIGFHLPQNKILINKGNTGDWIGHGATGIIINQGNTGDWVGEEATGTIIAVVPTGISGHFSGTRITAQAYKRNAALKTYVDRLLALAKDDPPAIEQEFGDGIAITERINELTRRLH